MHAKQQLALNSSVVILQEQVCLFVKWYSMLRQFLCLVPLVHNLLQPPQLFWQEVKYGRPPLFWTENPTKVLDGSKRQYIGKKDGSRWTGTRAATRWATRTTDFLPCHITIVARTGRGIEETSSDEGLWQRPKHEGKKCWLRWSNSIFAGSKIVTWFATFCGDEIKFTPSVM